MRFCKTIELGDYQFSDTFQHIDNMRRVLEGVYTPWTTEFRRWEYGVVLDALRRNKAKTVLEVGGGSSLFSASAIQMGLDAAVVDPDNYVNMFQQQGERIGKEIPFINMNFFNYPEENQFDAVTCISVIEHVPDHVNFFLKLLRHVKPSGLLCLTTDFHPSGGAVFGGHDRTYNENMLFDFIDLAQSQGFEIFGNEPDYNHFEPLVFNLYSFACMVMRKDE